jgi:hypothetical protein
MLLWHTDTEILYNTCLHSTTQNDARKNRLRNESYFNSDTEVESTSLKWRGHISDLMKKCYLTVRSICQRRRKKKRRETLIQATTSYLISHKRPRLTIRQKFPLKQIDVHRKKYIFRNAVLFGTWLPTFRGSAIRRSSQ